MSIQPLPGDVVAQIKSSATITSLNGVIVGLLRNSLDAGACKINVSVDYARGSCSVEDNGAGIPPTDFQEKGGLGHLHYTSKYPPCAEYHGRHGQFFASLAALSLLSIASHHREYRSHNSLTLHNSKVVARNTPALPEQQVLAFPSGTRVIVRDLFGSMPVRVKQRAVELERLGSAKTYEHLLFTIVALLLAWPGLVTLSLRDVSTRRITTLRTPEVSDQQDACSSSQVVILRTSSLLAQASLVEREDLQSWVPVGASVPGVSVSGCVCLSPVATKRVQFLTLGIQPLLNEHQLNPLYEEINQVFANSDFGTVEEVDLKNAGRLEKMEGFTAKELKARKGIDRWPMFFLRIDLEGEVNCVDADGFLDDRHHNMAVITDLLRVMSHEFLKRHHFRPKSVNAFDRLKASKSGAVAQPDQPTTKPSSTYSRSKSLREPRRSDSRSSARKPSNSTTTPASPFASWSRLKSGSATEVQNSKNSASFQRPTRTQSTQSRDESPQASRQGPDEWNPLFDRSGNLLRKPFDDGDDPSATQPNAPRLTNQQASPPPNNDDANADADADAETTENIVWVDPTTKTKVLIDPRTGFTVKPASSSAARTPTLPTRQNTASPRSKSQTHQKAPWLQDIISNWKNPAFRPVERPIPQVPEVAAEHKCGGHEPAWGSTHGCLGAVYNMELVGGNPSTATLQGRFSKDALRTAEVLGQVDCKFILVKISTEPAVARRSSYFEKAADGAGAANRAGEPERRVLVLIDQHAADERCRVEDLMKGYFVPGPGGGKPQARTERLDKPLRFEVAKQDGDLLARFRKHFERWGVVYEALLQAPGDDAVSFSGQVTVEVRSLPPSIMEKCRVEPRLLVELLRREIWRLYDSPGGGMGVGGGVDSGAEGEWVARFHRCPEGILEMINSRSCRSAIMFNDLLSLEQCRDLVRRLAECAFPFQCAHGRPSMAPLVDLGPSLAAAAAGETDFARGEAGGPADGLGGALKRWALSKKTEHAWRG
ncbi:putative MLH3 protein [Podospora appendiculata]|uniref:MLH3 protein n=1 Tax=Podospora appendiculata TaxID=314037 RepID=A0AAE0X2E1_9PEZI|nr:putative MLH3 protein [Podospora appendiculata]